MTASSSPVRRAAASILVAALALAATGCALVNSPYTNPDRSGGQTPAEAALLADQLPGIERIAYDSEPWDNPGEGGLFAAAGMDVHVSITVDDGHKITDTTAFYDQALRLAWSINGDYPKGTVVVNVHGGVDPLYTWEDESIAVLGHRPAGTPYRQPDELSGVFDRSVIVHTSEVIGDHLGRWPADPPTLDPALVAPGEVEPYTPRPLLPNPLSQHSVRSDTVQDCVTFSGEVRRDAHGGSYVGVVTVRFERDGEFSALTSVRADADDGTLVAVSDCQDRSQRIRLSQYTVTLSFDPADGFDTRDVVIRADEF